MKGPAWLVLCAMPAAIACCAGMAVAAAVNRKAAEAGVFAFMAVNAFLVWLGLVLL